MDAINPLKLMRFAVALVALTAAVLLLSPGVTGGANLPDSITARFLIFYGLTVGAYCILPFVRRGDIVMVAMWLVLGVGIAPCFVGEELSAPHMFTDMAGVLMAAAPIYIARFRQIAQGDTRTLRRRETEA